MGLQRHTRVLSQLAGGAGVDAMGGRVPWSRVGAALAVVATVGLVASATVVVLGGGVGVSAGRSHAQRSLHPFSSAK